MIEIKITLGPEAYEQGRFLYIWFDGDLSPFYVGETGKSPADRAGLHIRDKVRSGAIVSQIIQKKANPDQEYLVLSFPISKELLNKIAKENGATEIDSSHNRAQKALERKVYEVFAKEYSSLHKARGCLWTAKIGEEYAKSLLTSCNERIAKSTTLLRHT